MRNAGEIRTQVKHRCGDCEMAAKLTTVAVTCHPYTGEEAKNWDFDALAGAGAFRSTANDMPRNLKASQHGRRWIAV